MASAFFTPAEEEFFREGDALAADRPEDFSDLDRRPPRQASTTIALTALLIALVMVAAMVVVSYGVSLHA